MIGYYGSFRSLLVLFFGISLLEFKRFILVLVSIILTEQVLFLELSDELLIIQARLLLGGPYRLFGGWRPLLGLDPSLVDPSAYEEPILELPKRGY